MRSISRFACIMLCTTCIIQPMEEKESDWQIIEKPTPRIIHHDPSHTTEICIDGRIIDSQHHGHIHDEKTLFPDGSIKCFKQCNANWNSYKEISKTWHAKPTSLNSDNSNFIPLHDIPQLQQFAQQLPAGTIVGYYIQDDESSRTKTLIFPTNISISEHPNKNRTIYVPIEIKSWLKTKQKSETEFIRVTDHIHDPIILDRDWKDNPCYMSLDDVNKIRENINKLIINDIH